MRRKGLAKPGLVLDFSKAPDPAMPGRGRPSARDVGGTFRARDHSTRMPPVTGDRKGMSKHFDVWGRGSLMVIFLMNSGFGEGVAPSAVGTPLSAQRLLTPGAPATLASSVIEGAAYYISPAGNDTTGDGSLAKPWSTLRKATSAATEANSTIRVQPGTYLETQASQLNVGVSIEGAGDTSILKSTLTADWTEMLSLKSPEGTSGNQHVSGLKFDGQALSTFCALSVAGRSNVSIHDITVVDFKDRGVLISGRNDNQHETVPARLAKGITFYNNTISNSAAYQGTNGTYGRGCLNIGGTEGALIYNNIITQNQRPIGHNGWPIKGLYHNRGLKIYNNRLTKIPFTGAKPGEDGWDFALEMFYDQGTEFHHNTVIGGAFDTNWQLKGPYPYSLWIHDNTFSLPALSASNNDAIILELDTDSVIIENNVIDKMSNFIIFTPRPGNTISNVEIRNNLCTQVAKAGGNGSNASFINVHGGNTHFTINTLNIYNNTFIADPDHRPWWGIELGGTTKGGITNINIKNNILANTYSGAIVQGVQGGVVMDKVSITHNDIYGHVATQDPVWTGTAPSHYTYSNNIHVDPLFVSTASYLLQPKSACRGAGIDVGLPFGGAAPDIGYGKR